VNVLRLNGQTRVPVSRRAWSEAARSVTPGSFTH